MADAIRGNRAGVGQIGVLKCIHIGGPTSWLGNTYARGLQIGAGRTNTEGLESPCLELQYPGFWRFRWNIGIGERSILCYAKQVSNLDPRPALIVKANSDVGLLADLTAEAPSSAGWIAFPQLTFVASGIGVVWVELHNRVVAQYSPAYFDHIIAI